MTLPIYLLIPALILLPIAVQPVGCYGCVTTQDRQVTLFDAPLDFGTIGLLAHDYLAGAWYYEIQAGDTLVLIYPGSQGAYRVVDVQSVFPRRAQEPLVYSIKYTHGGLTLQTCNGKGFLFVHAELMDASSLSKLGEDT